MNNEKNGGFTLVELLLVIAIIGILAGVLVVGFGYQRQRAKAVASMQSARSMLSGGAVDCFFREKNLIAPTDSSKGGGKICAGSQVEWPELNKNCLVTDVDGPNVRWAITCSEKIFFVCDGSGKGNCCFVIEEGSYECVDN